MDAAVRPGLRMPGSIHTECRSVDNSQLRSLGTTDSAVDEVRSQRLDVEPSRPGGRVRDWAFEGPKPIDIFDAEIQSLPNEAERDAKLMRLFVEFVADQPMKFAGLVLVRLAMAVAPVSVSSEYHGGSTVAALSAWYIKGIPLIALVAAGVLLRARLWWRIRPLGLFVGYWMVMQSLAGPGIRYRLPADPVWACIIGVIGAAVLAKTLRGPGTDPLARRWVRASGVPRRLRNPTEPGDRSMSTAALG